MIPVERSSLGTPVKLKDGRRGVISGVDLNYFEVILENGRPIMCSYLDVEHEDATFFTYQEIVGEFMKEYEKCKADYNYFYENYFVKVRL